MNEAQQKASIYSYWKSADDDDNDDNDNNDEDEDDDNNKSYSIIKCHKQN